MVNNSFSIQILTRIMLVKHKSQKIQHITEPIQTLHEIDQSQESFRKQNVKFMKVRRSASLNCEREI